MSSNAATLNDSNGKISTSMKDLAANAGEHDGQHDRAEHRLAERPADVPPVGVAAQNQYNSLLTLASAAGLGSKGTGMLTGEGGERRGCGRVGVGVGGCRVDVCGVGEVCVIVWSIG